MSHRKVAFAVIAATLVLDALSAVAYARLTHIPVLPPARGPYDGLDWASATLLTTGEGGPAPLTRAQHWLWLAVHWSLIPLGAASLSFLTSGLTSVSVHQAKTEIMDHVEARLRHHLGKHPR